MAASSRSLTVTPTTLNFGNTTVNNSTAATVTISNTGSSALEVLNVALSNPGAFKLSGWSGQDTLQPAQSLQVKITFQPEAQTGYSSSLLVSGNGGVEQTVAMSGAGVAPGTVSVKVMPTTALLQAGQSQQFQATVTGTTHPVQWLVNGQPGGTSSSGTITSNGLYTAPATITSKSSVVVAAKVGSVQANASVTLTPPPSPVTVTISPTSASLSTGQKQQFTATVTGTSNTAVNWYVNGTAGGNSSVGTISTSGLYTAPSSVPSGSVTVTARSVYDSSSSASATVSITASPNPVSVSISPGSASLNSGQSQQFTATVTGSSNTAVSWSVQGVGTVSSSGLYTAPQVASTTTAKVIATSVADSSKSASAGITVSPSAGVVIDVTSYGATGNGSTDDTSSINAAIRALHSGYELYFPCGTYRVSSALVTITVQNVTVAGASGCTTIKGVNSGYTIMTVGTPSVSSQTALTATASELSNQFSANFANIGGLNPNDYVYIQEGGQDFSTDTAPGHPAQCDVSGCRGEIVQVQSVNGSTATVTTALHDTYNPSVNGARISKLSAPTSGAYVHDLVFDGSGTVSHGLYLVTAVNSTVANVTTQNFTDEGAYSYWSYNVTWKNIRGVHTAGMTFQGQGRLSMNGVSLSSLNSGSFPFNLHQTADCTISNVTVDKTGSGTGRTTKLSSTRYCTFNNLQVKNGATGLYNGLNLEYYSSHNTFNNCVVTGNSGNGIIGFGNYNQYNTFNSCTVSGNTVYQMWQGRSALGQQNDHYWTINGGAYTGQPGQYGIGLVSNRAYVHNVSFVGPSSGSTVGLSIVGSNGCVNSNTFSKFSTDIAFSGSNDLANGNSTPDGTSPGTLPTGTCP